MVTEYIKLGENVDDPDVKNTIYNDINKVMPLKPLDKVRVSSYHQISQRTAKIMGEKYKNSEIEVRNIARREAAKKYQLLPLRSEVQVKYRRGPFSYKYRGTLYARNVKDVQIDDLYVPYIDMEHETRISLDSRYNQKVRDEYVEVKLRDYAREMAQKAFEIQQQIRDEEYAYNESIGYIYDARNSNWMDAKEFADSLMAPESKLRSTVVRGTPESQTVTADAAEQDPYEKAMKKARTRLDEINRMYYGIDGDQGYKWALWGFSRPEVAIVLSKEKEFATLKRLVNADVLTLDGKERLELHYLNNILFKTIHRKGECNADAFRRFCDSLHQKYGSVKGRNDEEVKIYEAVVSGSLKADSKNSNGNVYSVSWNGDNTVGTLSFVYSASSKHFTDVVFAKEYKSQKR